MHFRSTPISKYAYLTAIFLILALCSELFFSYFNHSDKRHLRRFQHELRNKESKASAIIKNAESLLNSNPDFSELYNSCLETCEPEDDISVFISKNDSIIFWSSSEIPVNISKENPYANSSDTLIGNDLFLTKTSNINDYSILVLILLKHEYQYQNDYLVSEFQKRFYVPAGSTIIQEDNGNRIFSSDGRFLFSINFPEFVKYSIRQVLILFTLYSISLITLIAFIYHCYLSFPFLKERRILLITGFTLDLVIIRAILYYFEVPPSLYSSELFSPIHYASSFFNRSLGDSLLNSLIYLSYGTFIYYYLADIRLNITNRRYRLTLAGILILLIAILFYFLCTFINSLILNSSFPLQLNNFYSLNLFSWLGLFSIIISTIAFILFSYSLSRIIIDLCGPVFQFIAVTIIVLLFITPVYILFLPPDPVFFTFLILFLCLFPLMIKYFASTSLSFLFFLLLFFPALITLALNGKNNMKEKEFRLLLASDLISQRDPLTEYDLVETMKKIYNDTVLSKYATENSIVSSENDIQDYLHLNHIRKFGNKFSITITVCNSDAVLEINPGGLLFNCYDYFYQMIDQEYTVKISDSLYYLEDQSFNSNYLMIIPLTSSDSSSNKTIFIELYSRLIPVEGLGYPDLLIDKGSDITSKLASYSIALYQDEKLVYKYGDYSYSTNFLFPKERRTTHYFEDIKGYNHLVYPISNNNTLILSLLIPSFRDLTAPFSYLFILLGIFLLIYSEIAILPGRISDIQLTFRTRLQFSIISIILISFFVIGLISRSYLIDLHHKKNIDLLGEKTFSVLIEVEHKLSNAVAWDEANIESAATYLTKFSQVFFSDINLYDPQGILIASSRPQVFNEGLLSTLMNPEAYYKMSVENKLQFIQNERIGRQQYLSSYLPFRNANDQVMAYLNLPYFSKQRELQSEISSFLVAFINIYVLLIVLSVIIVVIASRYITKPLELVKSKIRDVQLGKPNEKIEWKHNDEIGALISEYNRMIDELAKSAELLARSERETAWREMAQQVAHEIKNPLTPMKLSIQHLKKAWDDKKPDYEERLKRFTETIVEQIDSLSDIASAFSDFARMPKLHLEKLDLAEVVKNASDLYKDAPGIEFKLIYESSEDFVITADRKQLLRVFNNLIQNSIHAVAKKEHGLITVNLQKIPGKFLITVEDNGTGIPEDQTSRIFSPNFTTKSGGTGLGLAMVKSIINSLEGEISFKSKADEGTSFFIELPR